MFDCKLQFRNFIKEPISLWAFRRLSYFFFGYQSLWNRPLVGLLFMGGNSRSRGLEFESLRRSQDGYFSYLFAE